MRSKGSPKELEQRRMRAMVLLDQGWSQAEVAEHLGVTPGAVSQWKKRYRRDGPDGVRAKPHPGPKPKLTPRQREQLGRLLLKGARAHGYRTELWTLTRVAEVIQKRFGVQYDPSGVWHVLRNMGWSCQKPERRARERNEQAIAQWRKKDWPRIKKSTKKRPKHRLSR
jgi:transposase